MAPPMPISSKLISLKTVPYESAKVYTRKRMDFGSNSVVTKSPNFMYFRLSPTNTPDKLKSIIGLTAIVGRLMNDFDWLVSRHDIEEVTVKRVSEEKVSSKYIKKKQFKTMKFFERENISVTWPTFPISTSKNRGEQFTISTSKNGKEQFTISTLQNGQEKFTISPSKNRK